MKDNVTEQIKDALYTLTTKMSIEKINISTIVKECGISRTLFYYYYEDMFALLEDILSTDMGKIMSDCIKIEDPYESVEYFVYCCSGHFPMLKKVLGTKYYETAERMVNKINRKYLREVYEHKAGDIPMKPNDITFLIDFMSAGITSYFFEHCSDSKFDIEESSRQILNIINKIVINI